MPHRPPDPGGDRMIGNRPLLNILTDALPIARKLLVKPVIEWERQPWRR